MKFDRQWIESALRRLPSTPIAHYTRIGTLSHFFPESRSGWTSARATPVQFLNDRTELSLGLEILRDAAAQSPESGRRVRSIIDSLLTSSGRLETDAFQMSFSGDPDELGQWRGYAANGMGCCVVTDSLAVHDIADVAGWVEYEPRRQRIFARKVLSHLRKEADNDKIEQVLVASACFMKHDGFAPEQEFRYLKFPPVDQVQFRESGDRLVPFVDFLAGGGDLPVISVIIGPGWQLARLEMAESSKHHVVQGIHRLISARGMHRTAIQPSRIPYDPR